MTMEYTMTKCGYKTCLSGTSVRPSKFNEHVFGYNTVYCECDKGQHLKRLQTPTRECTTLKKVSAVSVDGNYTLTLSVLTNTPDLEVMKFIYGHDFKKPVMNYGSYQGYDVPVKFANVTIPQ
jgi:hypothetical protein